MGGDKVFSAISDEESNTTWVKRERDTNSPSLVFTKEYQKSRVNTVIPMK